MSHPLKISDHEKINRYSPELTVSYPPPYNYLYVTMRSPKYLMPPENESYLVNYIQVTHTAQILDSRPLYDIVKQLIERGTDEYYDCLLKEEMYEYKSSTAGKVGDTLIFIPTKEGVEL